MKRKKPPQAANAATPGKVEKEILKKMRENLAQEASDNPFIASGQFIKMVKLFAVMPRIIIGLCNGPAEAMNAMESVMVTFLKNIPDAVWECFRKVADHPANAGKPNAGRFAHLDAIRNTDGSDGTKVFSWEGSLSKEDLGEGEIEIPAFNVKPPTTPV